MNPPRRTLPLLAGFALLVALAFTPRLDAAALPEGFTETRLVGGFTGATAMEIAPDGRLFVCEQTGTLRVVKDDRLLAEPFLTVTVDSSWERGLLGVAFDPHFGDNHFVYVNYIAPQPYPHHRLSRFTARGDTAAPDSEVILFEGDDQNQLGGGVKNGHQGGAIHFGSDGKLYVTIGDQTAGEPAQDLHTLQGKMLRLNADGSIPGDNPFCTKTTGKYRAIWALGLRNPFTFAVQPGTGRLLINDVGGANEEINEGVAGANYGWPTVDHGPTSDRRFRGPIYWYKESSITGGTFYNPSVRQFPAEYAGKYFFNDFKAGWMKVIDPDHPDQVRDFMTNLGERNVVDLKVGADGSLYYLSRNAWVKDNDFRPHTGALYRVRYTGARTPPHIGAQPAPQRVLAGGAAYFRVEATGSKPLHFQWQRNGIDLPGANAATCLLPAVSRADQGAPFRCVVTNAFGDATTAPAPLTVQPSAEETAAAARDGVVIQPAPGTYTGPVTVRLSPATADTILRYTMDGTPPTDASSAWTGPLSLQHTGTLTVRAFRDDVPHGAPVAVTFTIKGSTPYGLAARDLVSTVKMPPVPELAPRHLSQTGVFASLADLTPGPGLIPYTVNCPLWSDGAAKERWLSLPPGGRLGFAPTGEWTFPAGTVLVKHFELATDDTNPRVKRRLETRLLVVDGTGYGYGATYKWRADHSDADLVTAALTESIPIHASSGIRKQNWYYPSQADCLTCHTRSANFVLGVKTRQLNGDFTYPGTHTTDNQLRTWNYLGLFEQPLDETRIPRYSHLVSVADNRAPLVERARSYLDANCAHCHRPGNAIQANFDARYDTPLAQQGLLDAPTVSDSLGLINPRVIAPRELERSMLCQRLRRSDNFRMPPLATSVPDDAALAVLEQWIRNGASAAK